MRVGVVFCLALGSAMFGFGLSLQCYSCPDGSSGSCEVARECSRGQDSCLKLTSGEKTYTACLPYTDCDFRTLAVRYPLPNFSFDCCQSELCNKQEKSFLQKMKDFFG